ncbi:MFS transporter [Streptomyces avermitilis]|uniref:Transmembrane efflux protein n=2 Tax=Streptomyces avermitilis TaxID=33903 RepID=Q827I3_STRAW|nr:MULTISPECIES: MFS transporter [Streptomyces]KUN53526.1 MFS transporter [Streptomyces avermitilis]MYT02482.1 MFS transporter [Streptomyces sp. SID5469]BAC74652.1 putative transmembrane efflux protein [Streptomyces avermitilis MA-4680 = NBRC 14893]BBJ55241.1 MFS transporter [Streptomyces avermitilis]GDY67207.1 MFS transporter [Streptomyces avermitilis]
MSTTPPSPQLTAATAPGAGEPASEDGAFGFLRALGPRGRRAFAGAFGGYALDSYDYFTLPLSMVALAAYFGLDSGQTGLFTTVTLVVSAIGGAVAGVVADRIGRVKALMITVITYAVFTVACGFAPNYETLLVFRALQGLGFGGEWAVGAILVAEYASARHRGRTLGAIQSSWAVGWALAAVVYTLVFSFVGDDLAWRVMFWTGALPALLVVWVRRRVHDAPEAAVERQKSAHKGSFTAIFRPGTADAPGLLRITVFAGLLSTGVQGGYYTLATWVPTYLKTERGLSVVGTGGYLTFLISGAFIGYLTGGYLTDKLGRKRNILLFAVLSAICVLVYANIPSGADTLLLVLGFPLGFCMSAIFSGFGSFLSELYPTAVRGTGQGFTYNTGRAVGAVFPTLVGFLADSWGVGGALVFGAIGYALAALALLGLPETRGKELR